MKIRPLRVSMFYADRQTHMRDEANSRFKQFCDPPKSSTLFVKWVYVFCMDLRTNSDYFTVQH
jgi:hypothetical protein